MYVTFFLYLFYIFQVTRVLFLFFPSFSLSKYSIVRHLEERRREKNVACRILFRKTKKGKEKVIRFDTMPKHHVQIPTDYRYISFDKQALQFLVLHRILVFGDAGVGKTSLIARYVRNEYPCQRLTSPDNTTVYQTVLDGDDCRLIFIEIANLYDFQKLKLSDGTPTACFIIFSITDQRSFTRVNSYQEAIRLRLPNQPTVIIGNKIDLEPDRAVTQQAIDKFKSNGYDLFDISVRGNVGIGDAVYTVVKYLQYEQHHSLEKIKPNNACACVIA